MKKTMKQLVALMLSATMVFAAGCGTTPSSTTETQSKETVGTTEVKETETVATEEIVTDITYPLTADVELTVWDQGIVKPADEYLDYTQSPFHTGLAKKTGIDVKWTFPVAGTSGAQAWNLLLTEKELPDIIFRTWLTSEGEELINDGAIYDLTEYLPKYAPDYWEIVNRPEYAASLKAMTTVSGKQYIIASFPESTDNFNYEGPIVRKDWLDACGLDIPVTTEDWEEMLVAFKDKYGVAPFAMSKSCLTRENIASATGAYYGAAVTYGLDDNDKIIYTGAMPEWKEYLALMNKWYNDGLLDRDSMTMDNAALRSKAANNEVGVVFTALSQLTNYREDAKNSNSGAEWIPIGYPREAVGEPTSMIQTNAQHWSAVGVGFSTAMSEEELIAALQWANYGYTEEGAMYWNFGEEGVSYEMDANGKPQFTETVTGDVNGINAGIKKYTGASSNPISNQKFEFILAKNGEVGGKAVEIWTENTEGSSHKLPGVTLTEDETIIYTNLGAQMHTYSNEIALKFITGEEPLDNFDAYLQKLDSMGLQQILDIWNRAYERYKEN